MTDEDKLELFLLAFGGSTAGCRRECACGITYFDRYHSYDWEENEFEELTKMAALSPKYVGVDFAPGDLRFEGKDYVDACKCWHGRAHKVMGFIDTHAFAIADYLRRIKEQKLLEAEASPVVDMDDPIAPPLPPTPPNYKLAKPFDRRFL